jgi:monoamine oxidase
MGRGSIAGSRVIVLGAGLAGLVAARDLEADGAEVTVVEARDRVGGRVVTARHGFAGGQHAEAGGDFIEGEQEDVRNLAADLGLTAVRILRRGWGFYGTDNQGGRSFRSEGGAFEDAARRLAREIEDYNLAGRRWDSAVAAALAKQSVAGWMAAQDVDQRFRAGVRGLRGFFLADPEDLSLIALVDQFASSGMPGDDRVFRLEGGNGQLSERMASSLRTPVGLRHVVRRMQQTPSHVVVTVEDAGVRREITADYCVSSIPASTLRDVQFEPALPPLQWRAITTLAYGPATRVLLQFGRRFWRKATHSSAFGTDLPVGAVWDGNEEQGGRKGILSLLAGGNASGELQAILEEEGADGVVRRLGWLGEPAPLIASDVVVWEDEPWSKGGYAVFDPSFEPALRPWLARPAGRVVFAGEHTSDRWQGYMNGAVESGHRAAAEVRAVAQD